MIYTLLCFNSYPQNVGISDDVSFNPSFMFHIKPSAGYSNDLFSIQNNIGTYYLHIKLNGQSGINSTSTSFGVGDVFSVFASSTTLAWSINGYNSTTFGGSGFFENSSSTNGYNAMEGTTSYSGTTYSPAGLWGLAIASSGYGIGLIASTNSLSTSSYGLYAKCMYSNSNGYYAGYFTGRVYTTGNYYISSDEKLKTNFSLLDNSLNKLMQLKVYEYDFDKKYEKFISSNNRQVGFIAQDVQKIFPGTDLVSTISMIANNGAESSKSLAPTERLDALAISYSSFVPYIIKAIQEQQIEIEVLRSEIEILKIEIEKLKYEKNN